MYASLLLLLLLYKLFSVCRSIYKPGGLWLAIQTVVLFVDSLIKSNALDPSSVTSVPTVLSPAETLAGSTEQFLGHEQDAGYEKHVSNG